MRSKLWGTGLLLTNTKEEGSCCKFGNVVNRACLVTIFWVGKLVGANFHAFCNYVCAKMMKRVKVELFLILKVLCKTTIAWLNYFEEATLNHKRAGYNYANLIS